MGLKTAGGRSPTRPGIRTPEPTGVRRRARRPHELVEVVDDGGEVCAASGGFVAQLRARTDDDGGRLVPGAELLEAVHGELTTREAHLKLLRVCSATLRDVLALVLVLELVAWHGLTSARSQ